MNQEIPKWVIIVLVVGILAVSAVPPWQYTPYSKGGKATEFKGWHPWWTERPLITEGDQEGQHEVWKPHIQYLIYEIIGVCVVVFGIAAVAGRKNAA